MTETLVTFPHGLVGCESWKHFVLIETPNEPVHQLVCLDEPEIAFLVAEAWAVAPEYRVDLTEADEQVLGSRDLASLHMLCTLTMNREAPMLTANLVGPLVINRASGVGKQVVLVNNGYSLKHPVLDRLPERAHAHPH
jgi:flagellar assembly factor FliW